MHRSFLVITLLFSLGCASSKKPNENNPTTSNKIEEGKGDNQPVLGPFGLSGNGSLRATIQTTDGDLECDLFEHKAPKTVKNFVELGQGKKDWKEPTSGKLMRGKPFYNDLAFFRIVPGFFLQSGDPTNKGDGGPGYIFEDEFSDDLKHDRPGVLSMANKGPNTNGSQFFVLLKATPHLDGHHSVFGHCPSLDVIQKLASHPVDSDNLALKAPKIIRIDFSRLPNTTN